MILVNEITDIRTPTPFTQIYSYTIFNICSDTLAFTTTLIAISATKSYTAPLQTKSIGPLLPTSLYTLTYVFTDIIMTNLQPGDLLTLVLSSLTEVHLLSRRWSQLVALSTALLHNTALQL